MRNIIHLHLDVRRHIVMAITTQIDQVDGDIITDG